MGNRNNKLLKQIEDLGLMFLHDLGYQNLTTQDRALECGAVWVTGECWNEDLVLVEITLGVDLSIPDEPISQETIDRATKLNVDRIDRLTVYDAPDNCALIKYVRKEWEKPITPMGMVGTVADVQDFLTNVLGEGLGNLLGEGKGGA